MASCDEKLAGKFARECGYKPKTGIKRKWYINHDDIDFDASQLASRNTVVSALTLKEGSFIYPAEGNDQSSSASHSLSVLDFGNGYIHTDMFTVIYRGVNERERIQELVDGGRVVTLIEKVDRGISGELQYEILGFESGMKITEDNWNSNENGGTTALTVATKEGEEESTGAKLFVLSDTETTIQEWISTNEFTGE